MMQATTFVKGTKMVRNGAFLKLPIIINELHLPHFAHSCVRKCGTAYDMGSFSTALHECVKRVRVMADADK
jgi:hypothetical protein